MKILKLLCTLPLALAASLTAPLQAQEKPTVSPANPSPAAEYFTDTPLLDQDGRQVRFHSDMLKGKTVVIDTIFTTCTSICPVMSRTFAKVQEHIGDRLGKDLHLISISVDPTYDRPERLREYAARFGAKPGWYFLTGKKENVEFILRKLGQYTEDKESHTAIVLIGNEPTGLWKKAFGLSPPDDLIKIVDSVVNDQGEPSGR